MQDLSMLCTAHLNDDSIPVLKEAKQKTSLYCELAMALLLRRVSGHSHQLRAFLLDNELSSDETQIIVDNPESSHFLVWGWIVASWTKVYAEGLLPGTSDTLTLVFNVASSGRKAAALIDRYVNVQLPFAYVHMLILVDNLFLAFFSISQGIEIEIKWQSRSYMQIFTTALISIIVITFYQGLIIIMYMVRNPFYHHSQDIDLDRVMKAIKAHANGYRQVPSFVAPKHKRD